MIKRILSYDGNTFAPDYAAGFVIGTEPRLPAVQMDMLERIGAWPVIVALRRSSQRIALLIRIVPPSTGSGTDRDTLRSQLFRWFDPEDETPKALVGENHDGIETSMQALCEDLQVYGEVYHDDVFVATLRVSGDVRWRATADSSDNWGITASGQTRTINNTGEDEAYPVLSITPTGGKTGGYDYKRYVLVTWRAINPASNYPVRIGPLDTDALVTAGKMQADGDDLRVFVDGIEVSRYLVDIDDPSTYIWFSTDWQAAPALELAADLAGAGSIDSIELDDADEMAKLPSSGSLRIGSEVFNYSTRDLANKRLTGITRAAWGTSAGAHTAGDDVFWMQREIVLTYGSATASDPPDSTGDQPQFVLASSDNTEWLYQDFGQTGGTRPGCWSRWGNITLNGKGGVYTATERAQGTPYAVIGAWLSEFHGNAYGWSLYNACGIVNAAWADGKKRAQVVTDFIVHLMYWIRGESWWDWQATLADPALANTWEAWSEAAAVADWDPADYLALAAYFHPQDVEAGTVTVYLNSDETPATSIGSEEGNYTLAATITNETTEDAITVLFEMLVNETLEIDTEQRLVTYERDESNQFQAVSLSSGRRHWLRLLPGNNTLRFDDTGTAAVTLITTFPRRFY